MADPKAEDLTKEKSLLALWLVSFKFKARYFNVIVALMVGLLLARYCQLVFDQPSVAMAAFRKLQSTGLTFATSILGFLIAGFTVFVTVIRVDIFLTMAKHEKKYGQLGTGQSTLKYNLSGFMVVFVHYIAYIFLCMLCEIFLNQGGLASVIIANSMTYPELQQSLPWTRSMVGSVLLILLGTWTIYIVLLLKSFVFNVYQVTVTAVRWEWEHSNQWSD